MAKYYATIKDYNDTNLYLCQMKVSETIYISKVTDDLKTFTSLKDVINFVVSYLTRLTYGNLDTQLKYIKIRKVPDEQASNH